ncbi:alpha/beta fold hydrolase [Pseudorhodobacter sp. E13]|uniref:alpha/beta fold hydrolase n=1 Tax=Pseudorhodobacter sp. E13 TaxID=2487931 RepID=UPI000F8DBC19|nr:alpha/beta fold hydrolase [Pseudorhodobacter sp. E13]RUS60922.1 alpha/beta fold hydrolase [Pseudorhodobacter sp. E13]
MDAALHQLHIGDHSLAYTDTGDTAAPAVVFAHALGFDHRVWAQVLPLMPQGLRLVCYDLRGHGQSTTPAAPYAMGALIRDAETLLDHLNIRDCVFVGSAIGGMVAQGLAVKRLDLIRGLVLANTVTKLGTKDTWARLIAQTESAGLDARLETDLAQSFSAAHRKAQDMTIWRDLLSARRAAGFLGCAAAMAGTDFYTTTASLRLPCLIIASSEDAITPVDMVRELAGLIPGAQFELIRKSGHLPMIEQPETFARALAAFLYGIGHAPAL